uniref:NAC-A/B domain-containing protein n=1 Tax=Salvator merianae TaxID=96440 RepID=A0A8D0BKD3_SALMN
MYACKKVFHKTMMADDRKLLFSLKELGINRHLREVNMLSRQGIIIHFNSPRVQASLAANAIPMQMALFYARTNPSQLGMDSLFWYRATHPLPE